MAQSRRYFGTDGIRGRVGEHPMQPQALALVGEAIGRVLGGSHQAVFIAHDPRESAPWIVEALTSGLQRAGLSVSLLGVLPTPAVAYLVQHLPVDAAIMVSASHNLYQDNGIKLFNCHGRKLDDETELKIERVWDNLATNALDHPEEKVDSPVAQAGITNHHAKKLYCDYLAQQRHGEPLWGAPHFVVDCANGAMSDIAPEMFRSLGATITCIGIDPDGKNINQGCGSTSLSALKERVIHERASGGIAFDGDGDRVLMVDDTGRLIDGDEILFAVVEAYQYGGIFRGGVVGTLMSNIGLEHALEKQRVPFVRAGVGDRYVLAQLDERNWQVGGESSGHIICRDRATTGDGLLAAILVLDYLSKVKRPLRSLVAPYPKADQVLLNVPVQRGLSIMDKAQVVEAIRQAEQQLGEAGRLLIRPSGTEPLVRVMVEGYNPELNLKIASQVVRAIQDEVQRSLQA